MHPILLTCTPESDLLPVACFLSNVVGISRLDDLRRAVVRCPRILVTDVDSQLKPTLYFLRRIGFIGAHEINTQTSLLLVSSVETTLIPKLDYFQSLGFSYKEAVKLVLRSPRLFTHSIENNFKPKVEFLVREMGRDVRDIEDFPQYFSFSLEKKIKPRHQALVEHGLNMTLSEMLKISDGEFNDRLRKMRFGFI